MRITFSQENIGFSGSMTPKELNAIQTYLDYDLTVEYGGEIAHFGYKLLRAMFDDSTAGTHEYLIDKAEE